MPFPPSSFQWDEEKQSIEVVFKYQKSRTAKPDVLMQRCKVVNEAKTEWALSPKFGLFYIPIGIPYLILYCEEDYSSCIIGVPDRSYIWIMTRTKGAVEGEVREKLY
jgi:lipocalin